MCGYIYLCRKLTSVIQRGGNKEFCLVIVGKCNKNMWVNSVSNRWIHQALPTHNPPPGNYTNAVQPSQFLFAAFSGAHPLYQNWDTKPRSYQNYCYIADVDHFNSWTNSCVISWITPWKLTPNIRMFQVKVGISVPNSYYVHDYWITFTSVSCIADKI